MESKFWIHCIVRNCIEIESEKKPKKYVEKRKSINKQTMRSNICAHKNLKIPNSTGYWLALHTDCIFETIIHNKFFQRKWFAENVQCVLLTHAEWWKCVHFNGLTWENWARDWAFEYPAVNCCESFVENMNRDQENPHSTLIQRTNSSNTVENDEKLLVINIINSQCSITLNEWMSFYSIGDKINALQMCHLSIPLDIDHFLLIMASRLLM